MMMMMIIASSSGPSVAAAKLTHLDLALVLRVERVNAVQHSLQARTGGAAGGRSSACCHRPSCWCCPSAAGCQRGASSTCCTGASIYSWRRPPSSVWAWHCCCSWHPCPVRSACMHKPIQTGLCGGNQVTVSDPAYVSSDLLMADTWRAGSIVKSFMARPMEQCRTEGLQNNPRACGVSHPHVCVG